MKNIKPMDSGQNSTMTRSREKMSYRDIKRVVLERIQNRTWSPDSILPSETKLAEEFSSTRTTVNRALRELAEEGYLERKRKAGTRVLESPIRQARFAIPLIRDEINATGAEYRYFLIASEQRTAPDWLSARLNLSDKKSILHLKCMHYANNKPFQFENRWIVVASVPGVLETDFSQVGPNEWLVQTVPVSNIDLTFLATRAEPPIADFLDAAAGDALFTVERITWLRGKPVTYAKMHYSPGYRMTTHF